MTLDNNAEQQDRPDEEVDADLPTLEDAASAEGDTWVDSANEEARAAALSLEARALDGGAIEAAPSEPEESGQKAESTVTSINSNEDDEAGSDTAHLKDDSEATGLVSARFRKGEWQHEFSAHAIAVELRRIEKEVRRFLENRDPKRKRKFTGTRRWLELEEDILALRFTGRIDEDTIRLLLQNIARRHHLFNQLRFVASTRPTWNT